MMSYLAASQISSVEIELTGRNHSAMYFAANAVTSSIVGAISGSLIYEYIKNLFISKSASGIIWAQKAEDAADAFGFGGDVTKVYNLGNLLVPFIVCITCILGYFIAFKMPRDYTPAILASEFKKMDPSIDISKYENMTEPKQEKQEIVFVQVGLSVLSGFIFGFIWEGMIWGSVRKLTGKGSRVLRWFICTLIPFAQMFVMLRARKELIEEAEKRGVKIKLPLAVIVITSIILPLFPINVVSLAMFQNAINKLYACEE